MSGWFSFWRVQTKLDECTGPFSVGCTDLMCAKDEFTGVSTVAGSFIRFFYPAEKTAATLNESKRCFWIPRQQYASGLVNFMKLPVWLLGRFFYWCVGRCRVQSWLAAKGWSNRPRTVRLKCKLPSSREICFVSLETRLVSFESLLASWAVDCDAVGITFLLGVGQRHASPGKNEEKMRKKWNTQDVHSFILNVWVESPLDRSMVSLAPYF